LSSELLGPLTTQLGVGGIGGFIVGFALKKIAKLVAILLGLLFVGLQYLAYIGIIQINYDRLIEYAQNLVGSAGQFSIPSFLIANIPFAGAFVAGFALGFLKG